MKIIHINCHRLWFIHLEREKSLSQQQPQTYIFEYVQSSQDVPSFLRATCYANMRDPGISNTRCNTDKSFAILLPPYGNSKLNVTLQSLGALQTSDGRCVE
ncbi:hypothetical protein O6H91_09G044800 [Diphasiastrum complanatum]|uniref:Uncharacterized protein n=1 Tax=Diphasiastrum complanatum TaxID=34168 RepID=A0ACC2CNX7_DIPCM|nr:hypothetical protein O6H91_09G044800 [Diphasiastrum complanatum]